MQHVSHRASDEIRRLTEENILLRVALRRIMEWGEEPDIGKVREIAREALERRE